MALRQFLDLYVLEADSLATMYALKRNTPMHWNRAEGRETIVPLRHLGAVRIVQRILPFSKIGIHHFLAVHDDADMRSLERDAIFVGAQRPYIAPVN